MRSGRQDHREQRLALAAHPRHARRGLGVPSSHSGRLQRSAASSTSPPTTTRSARWATWSRTRWSSCSAVGSTSRSSTSRTTGTTRSKSAEGADGPRLRAESRRHGHDRRTSTRIATRTATSTTTATTTSASSGECSRLRRRSEPRERPVDHRCRMERRRPRRPMPQPCPRLAGRASQADPVRRQRLDRRHPRARRFPLPGGDADRRRHEPRLHPRQQPRIPARHGKLRPDAELRRLCRAPDVRAHGCIHGRASTLRRTRLSPGLPRRDAAAVRPQLPDALPQLLTNLSLEGRLPFLRGIDDADGQ